MIAFQPHHGISVGPSGAFVTAILMMAVYWQPFKPQIKRLVIATAVAVALATGAIYAHDPKPTIVIQDPCNQLEPGSWLWYLYLCF